ncbi:MAG: class I SAM-dependent methyltransferase [Acidimicrobiales bacterium]
MKSSHSPEGDQVATYFHRHAADFDAIYRRDTPGLRRLRDRLSRQTVVRRADFVDEFADRFEPESALDVGCGSARFALRLAPKGTEVVGLDFAPDMITLARKLVDDAGLSERCTFVQADFLEWDPGRTFDLVLAIGVLDYVAEPDPLMKKLAASSNGHVIVSFPQRYHPLVPLRFARLRMSHCPVYFYTRRRVEEFGRRYLRQFEVKRFGRDYLLVGQP